MAKFKVGDMVSLKFSETLRLHIMEVIEQTCYAGTQVTYVGRLFFKSNIYDEGKKTIWEPIVVKEDNKRFLEIELDKKIE